MFHRLISCFVDIYEIILIILFLGCMGGILLGLLMIQIDLAQVILLLLLFNDQTINLFYDFRPTKKLIPWFYLNRLFYVLVHSYCYYSLVKFVNNLLIHTTKLMRLLISSIFICYHWMSNAYGQ